VEVRPAAPDAGVAAGADLIAPFEVAGGHHRVQVAVAGFQPIGSPQLEGGAVSAATPHGAVAVVGGAHRRARDAGDVDGGMPLSHSLGDHPGHGMKQLQSRQKEGDGQQASAG